MKKPAATKFRSPCPVASALDLMGDKWTLVVLRTMFAGRSRFGDLLNIPERISTNILADRLALLEREGLIASHAYQQNPPRYDYRLTKKGAELLPVLQALARWAADNIPNRWAPPAWFTDAKPEQFYPR
jgi:DNA-binding HxlR family transcriptional regulator